MKSIEVVAAVIVKDNKVFSTQRGYGEFKDGWEFPGGKMEKGERAEDALVREIKEELDSVISVKRLIKTVEYDYPLFHITMHCYLCSLISGNLCLKEHESARFLSKDEIRSVDWLPADILVLDEVEKLL